MIQLKFFKNTPTAIVPKYATSKSACFDLCADLPINTIVKGFWSWGGPIEKDVREIWDHEKGEIINIGVDIDPGCRVLIPTGLIFDIPEEHSVRIYSRSGVSYKHGLILTNGIGVVDADYVEPVYISLTNISSSQITIAHGTRLAQAELVEQLVTELLEVGTKPERKTERSGGFGHTGS